jgi:hypothetical protein
MIRSMSAVVLRHLEKEKGKGCGTAFTARCTHAHSS